MRVCNWESVSSKTGQSLKNDIKWGALALSLTLTTFLPIIPSSNCGGYL